jgi:hypothetical protein
LIFLNIIEKQGVNLYIFPYFYHLAQPITKEESYISSFFISDTPRNTRKTAGFVFYFEGRTLSLIFPIFYLKSAKKATNIYFFEGLRSPKYDLQTYATFQSFLGLILRKVPHLYPSA